jgi:hypothetical protein
VSIPGYFFEPLPAQSAFVSFSGSQLLRVGPLIPIGLSPNKAACPVRDTSSELKNRCGMSNLRHLIQ